MKAHELISQSGAFTSGVMARDKAGNHCGATDPAAAAWSAEGALYQVYRGNAHLGPLAKLNAAKNGEKTQAEVAALLRRLDV